MIAEIQPGARTVVEATLRPLSGTLAILRAPEAADVFIDGRKADGRRFDLAPGRHSIELRMFGYRALVLEANVPDGGETAVEGAMDPAPFGTEGFRARTARFNPDDPGFLGEACFDFTAAGPGTATLRIFDETGLEVFKNELGPFATAEQTAVWDGTGAADGRYRAELSTPGNAAQTLFIDIDRTSREILSGLFRGLASDGPVPAAGVSGSRRIKLLSAAYWNADLLIASFEGAAGFPNGFEAGIAFAAIPPGTRSTGTHTAAPAAESAQAAVDFSIAAKKAISGGKFPTALVGSYSAIAGTDDSASEGAAAGEPVAAGAASGAAFPVRYGARAGAAAGARLSLLDFGIYAGASAGNSQGFAKGAEAAGCAGCSIGIHSGPVRAAAWGWIETESFAALGHGDNFSPAERACAGAVINFLAPGGGLLFSAGAHWTGSSGKAGALGASASFGVLF